MKKFTIITGFLLIPIYLLAQGLKESDLDKLLHLPGKVETYYSKGCEAKAKYLQELTQDAVTFFQNKLQDTFDIKLLVLNRRDWKSFVGGPYILSHFARDLDRIEMGVNNLYKIKLRENKTLYGKNYTFFWDFIAAHELGHYISIHKKIKGIRWTKEFFADYILIGFLLEKIPDWKLPSSISTYFKYLPLKYKSLEDFVGKNSSRIDPLNYCIYEVKFEELAFSIFKKRGWDFMFDYIDRFTFTKSPPPDNNHLEFTITEFQKMEPEIFNEWIVGMRKTYHSYLILCILLAIVATIRLLDNSFSIFTKNGLKTKKRYRLFGVSTFAVLSQLKSFDSQKTKTRLKLIIGLRPIMYLCFTLLILLLILHH